MRVSPYWSQKRYVFPEQTDWRMSRTGFTGESSSEVDMNYEFYEGHEQFLESHREFMKEYQNTAYEGGGFSYVGKGIAISAGAGTIAGLAILGATFLGLGALTVLALYLMSSADYEGEKRADE